MTVFRMTGENGKVTVTGTKNESKNWESPYKDILAIDLTYVPSGSTAGTRLQHFWLQQWKDNPDWFILKANPTVDHGGIVLSKDEARHLALAILGEVEQSDLNEYLHTNEHLRELDAIDATYLAD